MPDPESSSSSSLGRLQASAFAGMFVFGIVMAVLGAILPSLFERIRIDKAEAGGLFLFMNLAMLVMSLAFGPIVDRFGYKYLLIGSSFLVALSFAMLAFAPSYGLVILAAIILGLGGGGLNGGTNALVADISGSNRESRLSLLGVFFGVGALGMPMVTALLLRLFAPGEIIAGFGLAVLLPVVYFVLVRFPAPKQVQGFPIREGAALVRDTTLLLLSMILFFESAAEGLMNNWTPAFLQGSAGLGTDESLYMLTVLSASLTVTRLVLGGLKTLGPPLAPGRSDQ